MLSLLALALMTAAPPGTAVAVGDRSGVGPDQARLFAARIESILRQAGVRIALTTPEVADRLSDMSCGARRECWGEAAKRLRLPAIVVVHQARVAKDLALALEAISAAGKEVGQADAVISPSATAEELKAPLRAFVDGLVATQAEWEPQAVPAEDETERLRGHADVNAVARTQVAEVEEPVELTGPIVGAVGATDVLGRSVAPEPFAGFALHGFEATVRARIGPSTAIGLQLGYSLALGPVQPFAGVRADDYLAAGAFGAGVHVGLRVPLAAGFGVLGSVGGEDLFARAPYRGGATLVTSLGVDWR